MKGKIFYIKKRSLISVNFILLLINSIQHCRLSESNYIKTGKRTFTRIDFLNIFL